MHVPRPPARPGPAPAPSRPGPHPGQAFPACSGQPGPALFPQYNIFFSRDIPDFPIALGNEAGPQPFHFCLSHGMDAALNSTEEMRCPQTQLHTTVGCKVATLLKDALFKLASVTDTSMNHNNYMKRFDHCLWLCHVARTTII